MKTKALKPRALAVEGITADELDTLDAAIARIEGLETASIDARGRALRPDQAPYRPTRCPIEALRLMDKYISRTVRIGNNAWAAVGSSGRACDGPTLPIAVCRAILASR